MQNPNFPLQILQGNPADYLPVVRCAVLNKSNELLMVERTKTNEWEIPGGKVNLDERGVPLEDPLVALKREVKEETGLSIGNVSDPWLIETHYIPDGPHAGKTRVTFGYLATSYSGTVHVDDESNRAGWLSGSRLSAGAIMTPVSAMVVRQDIPHLLQ